MMNGRFRTITVRARRALGLSLLLLTLAGCQDNPVREPVPPGSPNIDYPSEHPSPPTQPYRIGAFNLHNFGPARLQKPEAMQALVTILRRYDIAVLMEIRDRSGMAAAELLAQLNTDPQRQYALKLSSRLGRGERKEQYGLLYRPERVSIDDIYEYDDGLEPNGDLFSREPMVAYLDLSGLTVSLIMLHADPNAVALELNRLIPVYEDAVQREGDPDAIILGDLNADCGFLPDKDKPFVRLLSDARFRWLLGDAVDTTVHASTDCAYDRIIVTKTLDPYIVPGSARVENFTAELGLSESQALEVSDHYPVEVDVSAESVGTAAIPP